MQKYYPENRLLKRGDNLTQEERSKHQLLRGLINIRPAQENGENFLRVQDEYLREEDDNRKGITDIAD